MSKRLLLVALGAFVVSERAFGQKRQWKVEGDLVSDALGASVTYVPDVDGDGVVDFLVGAPGGAKSLVGKAILYSGATKTPIGEFDSDEVDDAFGAVVLDMGDVDGDGVRDFAISAPRRIIPTGTDQSFRGAIVVVSGLGPVIWTRTGADLFAGIGDSGRTSWVGDVDGDGVRDLVYCDYGGSQVVYVVSGKTGATIRIHTSSVFGLGYVLSRVGDVDADGIDDYALGDLDKGGRILVHSGANGTTLLTIDGFAAAVAPAGDVDLDGHADFMLSDGLQTIHVVSGATGSVLYDLVSGSGAGAPVWTAMSQSGDLDGDGHPDLVASAGGQLFVFSGASGAAIAVDGVGGSHPTALDATADVDGDGLDDLLAGDSSIRNSFGIVTGEVALLSGSDGASLATIDGGGVQSNFGTSCTLTSDLDGDGWRDVAVVVPGGRVDSQPNLVVVLSGSDGHELSRFQTTNSVDHHDREIVAIGDVDGDGVEDLAVACPTGAAPPVGVELHSGADGSSIVTLAPSSGLVHELAAAADVDGTPLLAVSTDVGDVEIFDLGTDSVVATCTSCGGEEVACIGDVDGDGHVDWVVRDPSGFGTVHVFSGASGALIWTLVGTSTSEIDHVAGVGDLDGDGLDDVLVSNVADNHGTGVVTARSGTSGAKIFDIKSPSIHAGFGSSLAPLGDVNRDGVADFVVGASKSGNVYVYSGATATQLYRFDSGYDAEFVSVALADVRWHDAGRVDGDRIPDLVVGSPHGAVERGLVQLFLLDDLMLQVDPPSPAVGFTVTATTRGGPPGKLVGLYALDLSGAPLDYFLALGTFNSKGNFAVTDVVPSSMQGLTLDVISYGIGFNGKLEDSEETAIEVQ